MTQQYITVNIGSAMECADRLKM